MYLRYSLPEAPPGFAAVLSLRAAGDMAVAGGRNARLEAAVREFFPGRRLVVLKQRHTRRVVAARTGHDALLSEADGLVTDDRRLALGVTVADCMPIWLVDTQGPAFGLVHSGWKGTGIVAEAVAAMGREFGSRPEALAVLLGPAIGPCCYTVDQERAEAFRAEFGPRSVSTAGGRPRLDLRAANLGLLERIGVTRYTSADSCTCCDSRFGSFRREGKDGFTRMLAIAGYTI